MAKPEWKKSGVGVRVREGAAQGGKVRRRGGRAQEKATQNLWALVRLLDFSRAV